ncbi:TetR/AcrR family transcriptional regulator [Nocardia sp. CA-129566]|uniref:TetR/AcrR family transcriptional regulator n=1 Tax=Nocardia sp. CA-129566 TaxID=3239976 RepID=UPI003D966F21
MGRPRRPLLSRDRIVSAALDLVDAEGLEAVSIRRLATELGVQGPSLYNHVATKDDLLDAMVDAVLGRIDLSMFTDISDWQVALRDWARSYRAALAAHPKLVPALNHGMGRRPNALRQADAVFGGLVAAGWPRREATQVGALMRFFVTGSTLGSFAGGFPEDAAVYRGNYPHLDEAHLLSGRQRDIDDAAFETGLRALLDGLALRFAALEGAARGR